MKTCPICGAENLQTAASCRLCATPIEGPDELMGIRAEAPMPDRVPVSLDVSGPEPSLQQPSASEGGHAICPSCQTVNESGWMYCQQCGFRLPRQEQSTDDDTTVPEVAPQAAQPNYRDLFKTNRDGSDSIPEVSGPPEAPTGLDQPAEVAEVAADQLLETQKDVLPQPQADPEGRSLTTKAVCPACGSLQSSNAVYCMNCGTSLVRSSVTREKQQTGPQKSGILKLIVEGGQVGATYQLGATETVIGRQQGDITFPHDAFMSTRHARIVERNGRYFLTDEKSRNGTYLRIYEEVNLEPNDCFLAGKQVFRFEEEKSD
jgi:ribosomal protein L40E